VTGVLSVGRQTGRAEWSIMQPGIHPEYPQVTTLRLRNAFQTRPHMKGENAAVGNLLELPPIFTGKQN